ncbi:hypothetical protein [Acidisoma silvae]|uniref:Uncharacterized protein n=1 Tax=Acidisoma silvae TaxID=2802396 RepID=A0A963YVS8_9PROT|nr:hypothetical protein [Acidisoma silvae]MCB8877749.1 hypothetical protein [Acidisoma silvae]
MNQTEYAAEIVRRLVDAVPVPYRPVSLNYWKPHRNDPHGNVDMWVIAHPGSTAVRGWLVDKALSLTAYSVVRDQLGFLFDITPISNDISSRKFVEHGSDDSRFHDLRYALNQTIYWDSIGPDELDTDLETL